jgi:hypothetical protein
VTNEEADCLPPILDRFFRSKKRENTRNDSAVERTNGQTYLVRRELPPSGVSERNHEARSLRNRAASVESTRQDDPAV